MSGYTKLFSSILDSTVWQEDKDTKLVWVTMLAMKNRHQIVEASVPGLAKRAGVSINECQASLEKLKAPDPFSRTKENDGRRIEDVEGGWRILNGEKYRDKMSPDELRAYKAAKQREYRAAKKTGPAPTLAEQVHEEATRNGDDHTAQRIENIQAGNKPTLAEELGGDD
jgi:hypothetical protein